MKRKRLTPKQRADLLERQGGVCCVPGCGSTGPFDEEHSTPFAWTGELPDQLMCKPCHKAKTKRDIKAIAKVKRIQRKNDPDQPPKKSRFPMKGAVKDKFKASELATLQKLGAAKKLIFEMKTILERGPLSEEDAAWFRDEAEKLQ